jgi:hypothetical protein
MAIELNLDGASYSRLSLFTGLSEGCPGAPVLADVVPVPATHPTRSTTPYAEILVVAVLPNK